MILQYPHSAPAPGLQRPDPPVSLRRAVAVMYAGAAISVTQAITYVLTESATKRAIENGHPRMSASTVNTLAHAGVIIGAVIAVLAIIAFVSIARSCAAGKNSGRIAATVLCALAVLGTIYNLSASAATVNRIFGVAVNLIGLAAVVLLWRRSSSAWFSFFKRP
jgi:hypothetical protein